MSIRDALFLSFPKSVGRKLEVYLRPVERKVCLRHGTSDVMCLQNVFLDQEYETPFPADPKVVIDGGANIGLTTLYFSQKFPKAKIIAIEPEPSNFEMLKKNCGDLPGVVLVNAALWPTERTLVIQDASVEKWAFSVGEGSSLSNSESVKAITIPELLRKYDLEYIDILKLDIEGAERELFKEGAESWLGDVGQIIIELHDRLRPGCAFAFYSKIIQYPFDQATKADNVFVNLRITA
jgi:FkbM family methyltransferase